MHLRYNRVVKRREWYVVVGRKGMDGRKESGGPESLQGRYRRAINRVVATLREKYKPDKIILFSSCSRGDFHQDSDVDLLIVKETSKRPLERMREVYELVYSLDHYLALSRYRKVSCTKISTCQPKKHKELCVTCLDPLVYTPEELAQRLALGDLFIQEIVDEGELLYERETESRGGQ